MCLIAFSWMNHPTYKLILIANRDEFYKRKTQKAHFWEENSNILAGKDLEGGGTWMGVSKNGRFTALTNYRDIKNIKPNAPSRGLLTANYLQTKDSPAYYLNQIATDAPLYNGFNLLLGNMYQDELYYFSNYENKIHKLEAGLYGLSNHLLDTLWYKVAKVKDKLHTQIQKNEISTEMLLDILHDREVPEDSKVQQTGLPIDKERMLASMFIESPDYGTRCSSILLIDYQNQVNFTELIHPTSHSERSIQHFTFNM